MWFLNLMNGMKEISFPLVSYVFNEQIDEFLGMLANLSGVLGVSVASLLMGLIGFIVWLFKRDYFKQKKECKEFLNSIDSNTKEEVTKLYIPTTYQRESPNNADEFKEANKQTKDKKRKNELIRFFMKEVFTGKENAKYYIVLADAGMGKTTFLYRLYWQYTKKMFKRNRYQIKCINLAGKNQNYLEEIKKIENQRNTILLLDALDEMDDITKNLEEFRKKFADAISDFGRVVITCRIQFFQDEDEESNFIVIHGHGMGNKTIKLAKKYISPFDDRDVEAYLSKKIKLKGKRKAKAKEIVEKIPYLTARPMILKWIDMLIDENDMKKMKYSCQIYEIMINKWLEREGELFIRDRDDKSYGEKEAKQRAWKFCLRMTEYMMRNKPEIEQKKIEKLAEEKGIELAEKSSRRILLARNASGIWKFSHRSLYEFLVAWKWHFEHEDWMDGMLDSFSAETKRFLGELSLLILESKELLGELSSEALEAEKESHVHYEYMVQPEKISRNNLSGFKLQHAKLASVDLKEKDLSYADLSLADLMNADLTNADITGVKLTGVDLAQCNLFGASYRFGNYKQEKNALGEYAPSKIEWQIMDIAEGEILLLSKKILEARKYHNHYEDVLWENSDIRKWLNDVTKGFLGIAFSDEERNLILEKERDTEKNPFYENAREKERTCERIFLLSYEEVVKYWGKYEKRDGWWVDLGTKHTMAYGTEYAKKQTPLYVNNDLGTSLWWLRSGGSSGGDAMIVLSDGSVDVSGNNVHNDKVGIRPALWIRI